MAQAQQLEQEHITLNVPSRFEYIRPIQAFIAQLARQRGICQKRIYDLELIVDEICGNAIEHGSDASASGIELNFMVDSHQMEILVRDKGKGVRKDWLSTGRLNEVAQRRDPGNVRGHGIHIVKALANKVEIQQNDLGGTDVRVIFNLSEANPS